MRAAVSPVAASRSSVGCGAVAAHMGSQWPGLAGLPGAGLPASSNITWRGAPLCFLAASSSRPARAAAPLFQLFSSASSSSSSLISLLLLLSLISAFSREGSLHMEQNQNASPWSSLPPVTSLSASCSSASSAASYPSSISWRCLSGRG
ncbi:hypothetical protein VPH35_036191 [Triticum aestivum]